jgi:hypothetical protein
MYKKDTHTHTPVNTILISREVNSVSQEFDDNGDYNCENKFVIWCYFSNPYEDFSPESKHILPWILKNIPQVKIGCNEQYGRTGQCRKRYTTL